MDLLEKSNVQILKSASDWKDAIRKSVQPLEVSGCVTDEYAEAIIQGVEKLGPYIIIAPSVALPHARPEQGVLKSQIAVTVFEEAVPFDKREASAQLFITLAAADSNSHVDALVAVSEILQDEEKAGEIIACRDLEKLYEYFN